MAVPKKRTGKSAQATRRANWKATKPEVNVCPNCGAFVLAHTVCTACGFYKGKPVSIKDAAKVEEVAPKKTAKKTTKKEEVAAVETVETKEAVEATVETTTEEKPKKTRKTTKKAEGETSETKTKKTTKKSTKKAE